MQLGFREKTLIQALVTFAVCYLMGMWLVFCLFFSLLVPYLLHGYGLVKPLWKQATDVLEELKGNGFVTYEHDSFNNRIHMLVNNNKIDVYISSDYSEKWNVILLTFVFKLTYTSAYINTSRTETQAAFVEVIEHSLKKLSKF